MDFIVKIVEALYILNEVFWLYIIIDALFEKRYGIRSNRLAVGKMLIPGLPILFNFLFIIVCNRITVISTYTAIIIMCLNIIITHLVWRADIIMAMSTVGIISLGSLNKDIIIKYLFDRIGGQVFFEKATNVYGVEKAILLFACGAAWFVLNILFYRRIVRTNANKNSFLHLMGVSTISYFGFLFIALQLVMKFVNGIGIMMIIMVSVVSVCIVIPYFLQNIMI